MNWNLFESINLLIVEKEKENRKIIIDSLPHQWHIHCIETSSIIEAVEHLDKEKIDIVLIDFNIVDINHTEIFKKMKEKITSELIALIVVVFDKGNVGKCRVISSDNFLFRPLDSDELETNLYNYMKSRKDTFDFQRKIQELWNIFTKVNLLIVEDDAFNRELIISSLSDNITPIEAENGIEALEVLEKNKVDIILLDLHMPKMNGASALRKIKEDTKLSLIPVIVITSDKEEVKNFKILEEANDFLFKPIQTLSLEQTLAKHIKNIKELSPKEEVKEVKEVKEIEEEILIVKEVEVIEDKKEYIPEKRGFIKNLEYKLFNYLKSRLETS